MGLVAPYSERSRRHRPAAWLLWNCLAHASLPAWLHYPIIGASCQCCANSHWPSSSEVCRCSGNFVCRHSCYQSGCSDSGEWPYAADQRCERPAGSQTHSASCACRWIGASQRPCLQCSTVRSVGVAGNNCPQKSDCLQVTCWLLAWHPPSSAA